MKTNKPFSATARFKSFGYAVQGILAFFRNEHNAVIHLLVTIIVAALAIILSLSRMEIVLIIIVCGGVWMAELFNTAIERTMDFISKEYHPAIKVIKNLSAAAVLVMAVVAMVTGCIVFIPKL